jgi:hypothetical protein
MTVWRRRWSDRLLQAGAHRLLQQYPPDEPLWSGGAGAAALRRLVIERTARVARLAHALQGHGFDLRAGLAAADPRPLVLALDTFCDVLWAASARREWVLAGTWHERRWPDPEHARCFAVVTDIGIALGERAIAGDRTCWGWDIGLDGAIVVGSEAGAFDPLNLSYARYEAHACARPAPRFLDAMAPLLAHAPRARAQPSDTASTHRYPL